MVKNEISIGKKSRILLNGTKLNGTNSPSQKLKGLYGRGLSLDRSDSFGSRNFVEENKRYIFTF